jgi:hypothetical protein
MGNMSYCRFENTLADLQDCQQALNSIYEDVAEMSRYEKNSVVELVALCKQISDEWGIDEVQEIIDNDDAIICK